MLEAETRIGGGPAGGSTDALLIVELLHRPGAVSRIVNMLYRRGIEIRGLSLGDAGGGRVRVAVRAQGPVDDLGRLVPAIANLVGVEDVRLARPGVARELCLVRMRLLPRWSESWGLALRVLEESSAEVLIEAIGAPAAIDRFLDSMDDRSVLGVSRGGATLRP